jgi:hypothetical protein
MSEADAIAAALLYEGYVLYPYRASSLKNRRRLMPGGIHPRAYAERGTGDRWWARAELLATGEHPLEIELRFLRLVEREGWHRAQEQRVALEGEQARAIELSGWHRDGEHAGPISARVATRRSELEPGLSRVSIRIENVTPLSLEVGRDEVPLSTLVSAHLSIRTLGGELVSLLEPPPRFAQAARACDNDGLFPVLVGEPPSTSHMLAAPIILYDYPRIAPESPADLFDATEIDEILTLRVLTLTDEEKRAARATDERARRLIDGIEALTPEELARLHGALRGRRPLADVARTWELAAVPEAREPAEPVPERHVVRGRELSAGTRVRLRPSGRADGMDLLLAGHTATIERIEQDLENRVLFAVTLDEDPGGDLGRASKPGHRFFFRPEEVEPL